MNRVNSTYEKSVPSPEDSPLSVSSSVTSGSPFVAHLLIVSIFIFTIRQTLLTRGRATTSLAVDTFAAVDIFAVCLAASVLILSGSFERTWSSLRRTPIMWLVLYCVISAGSFMWSEMPILTLYRGVEYLVFLFATLTAVAQYRDFVSAERAFLGMTMATIVFEICTIFRVSGFSLSLSQLHTNTFSASSAILVCYCLGEYLAMSKAERIEAKKRSRRLLLVGILSFCTLAIGTSAGSNIGVAVGFLLILTFRRRGLLLAGLLVGLLLVLGGLGSETLHSLLLPGKSENVIETASGRTILWEFLWQKFLQRPILGYGFGMVAIIDRGMARHAHNSLFPVLIGTGVVGLFWFAMFPVRLWMVTIKEVWRRLPGTLGFTGALAAFSVNCMTVNLLGDRWKTTSFVFFWVLGVFLIHIRGRQQSRAPEIRQTSGLLPLGSKGTAVNK